MNEKKKPLYKKIFDELYEKIESGELAPGYKLPPEPELAREFNVSRVTLARALAELTELKLITRTKKAGTFVSGATDRGRPLTIPVILPYNDQDNTLINAIHLEADKFNCLVPHYNTFIDAKNERNVLTRLLEGNVDGIIINPASTDANLDIFGEIVDRGIPLVFVDYALDSVRAPLVTCDNMRGMYSMVRRCIELGHRRIAYFASGTDMLSTERERLKGYYNALIDSGVPVDPDCIFRFRALDQAAPKDKPDALLTDCRAFADSLARMAERPTVVCCSSDIHAIYLMNTLLSRGYSIPGDISITGFDNIHLCNSAVPPLTSVSQNFDIIGTTAFHTVLDMINNKEHEFVNIIPTDIIMRESLKAV